MLFLPADVARLVLDYLGSEGYEKSCETFLLECNHVAAISDYIHQNSADIKDILPLADKSLTTILHEYSVNKLALKRKKKQQKNKQDILELHNESEINSEAFLKPFQGRNQCFAMKKLQLLRLQQEKDAKAARLKKRNPVLPLTITYSDIPPGAVIIDPPETASHSSQRSNNVSRSLQSQTASTRLPSEGLPVVPSNVDRIVVDPANFCNTRQYITSESVSSSDTLNPAGGQKSGSVTSHNIHLANDQSSVILTNQNSHLSANQLPDETVNQFADLETSCIQSSNQYANEVQEMDYISASPPIQPSPEKLYESNQKNTDTVIGRQADKDKDKDTSVKTGEDGTSISLGEDDLKEFPMLLEKLLSDSYLQQKLAENINKALPSENNQPTISTPIKPLDPPEVESRKVFTDSFLDAHLSEDTIQDIVNMTTVDPAFEGLFNLFNISKQEFLQEHLNQREKSLTDDNVLASNEMNNTQHLSPTKSFLFNECSNSALIPNSPEKPASGLLDNPSTSGVLDNPSASGLLDKLPTSGLLDKPTTSGLLDEPIRSDLLDKPTTSGLLDKPTNSGMPDKPTTSGLLDKPLEESSDVPDNSGRRRKSRKPSKKDVLEPSSIVMMSTGTPKKQETCARTSPFTARKTNSVLPKVSDSEEGKKKLKTKENSPIDSNCYENINANSEKRSNCNQTSMLDIPHLNEKHISRNVKLTKLSQENVEPSERCLSSKNNKIQGMNLQSSTETTVQATITERDNKLKGLKDKVERNKTSSSLKCFETFPEFSPINEKNSIHNQQGKRCTTTISRSVCRDLYCNNSKSDNEFALRNGDEGRTTSNDLPSEVKESTSSVSFAAKILACAMEESRSPVKLNQILKTRPSPKKKVAVKENTTPSQENNEPKLSCYTDVSSTSGFEYKPSEVKTATGSIQSTGCNNQLKPSDVSAELVQTDSCDFKVLGVTAETEQVQSEPCHGLNKASAEMVPEIVPVDSSGCHFEVPVTETQPDQCHNLRPLMLSAEIIPVQSEANYYEVSEVAAETDHAQLDPAQFNYELKPSEMSAQSGSYYEVADTEQAQIGQCNNFKPLGVSAAVNQSISLAPIINISHKSEPQIVYSCPVEVVNTYNSVIRPKTAADNPTPCTKSLTSMNYRKRWQQQASTHFKQRPILPAGSQLNSVNQVINIPCLIDPILIGPSEQASAPIPISYIPHNGDSSSLDNSNIFSKISNFSVIPFSQNESSFTIQNLASNPTKTGVNISNLEYGNSNASNIISSVASKSELFTALRVKENDALMSTKLNKPVKKSNRGKRRIRPIPVNSEKYPHNSVFMSAVEKPVVENKNTNKLQTIDLMDLHAIQTASSQECINIIQTPVKVVVRRTLDGVTSLQEVNADTSQSPLESSPNVSQGSASKGRVRLRKQDLSSHSHIRILDFEDNDPTFEDKVKVTKGRKTKRKGNTKKQVSNKTNKNSPAEEKSIVINNNEEIKTNTPKKLGEDLPFKKRPLPDSTSDLCETTIEKSPFKSPKLKQSVRRSPRKKASPTEKSKSPGRKLKPEEKKTKKSPRKRYNKKTACQAVVGSPAKNRNKPNVSPANKKLKDSPVQKGKKLKSSLRQTESAPPELKHVSFGEVDCITLNSPDVSHNIDQEVNEAAQLLMDMASSSPSKFMQEKNEQLYTTALHKPKTPGEPPGLISRLTPAVPMISNVTPGIETGGIKKSPRKQKINEDVRGAGQKRKRNSKTEKKSTKKRKGFPKNMDVDKFLSGLKYCD
ncbi:uncharacterized protein [Antedon mediterranea]|uniref:uncharacterized protein n=1 Tax=Antedon mediterranea TaxID=105859 RepID=UPI003AF97FC0